MSEDDRDRLAAVIARAGEAPEVETSPNGGVRRQRVSKTATGGNRVRVVQWSIWARTATSLVHVQAVLWPLGRIAPLGRRIP